MELDPEKQNKLYLLRMLFQGGDKEPQFIDKEEKKKKWQMAVREAARLVSLGDLVDGSGASVDRQFCLPASRPQKKTDLALRVRRPCGARAVRDEALRRVASGLLHRFRAARSAFYGRHRQHLLSDLWASAAASRRL